MNAAQQQDPIVLVHGIFGFDRLAVGGLTLADYFRGIAQALRDDGWLIPNPPRLNLAGSIGERASDLAYYLQNHAELAGRRVHLIAHSMGGLDARHMISNLGLAGRVISLTTIGTPHHGSPVADTILAHADPALGVFLDAVGIDVTGISNLSTGFCRQFNRATMDSAQVRYFSVAGRFEPPRVPLLGAPLGVLGLTHDHIAASEGANDGLVSVRSARFGQDPSRWTFLGEWGANHFRLVNWGTDLLPTLPELRDSAIIDHYRALARRITAP